jgi:hypothetical protein
MNAIRGHGGQSPVASAGIVPPAAVSFQATAENESSGNEMDEDINFKAIAGSTRDNVIMIAMIGMNERGTE